MTSVGERLIEGDRRALAQAITLVESLRPDHRTDARALLDEVLPHTGRALRIGLSGAPGAGKSTLVEALGLHAISEGHRVAVLAIDPSSALSGGSILGDKTRMSDLGRHEAAYIRPSPTGGTLGGVARRTREALLLCEAAGYDVVLVETVGVGQSEVAVGDLVDLFVLIAAPGGGDELQGIKRGIMELADLIVVNKADGDLAHAAQRAASDLRNAVHLLRPKRPGWQVDILMASAQTGTGVAAIWEHLIAGHRSMVDDGTLVALRSEQAVAWMWNEVREDLLQSLETDPTVRSALPTVEAAVRANRRSPGSAAQELLALHDPRTA